MVNHRRVPPFLEVNRRVWSPAKRVIVPGRIFIVSRDKGPEKRSCKASRLLSFHKSLNTAGCTAGVELNNPIFGDPCRCVQCPLLFACPRIMRGVSLLGLGRYKSRV